jgi:hypothetical protein
MGETGRGAGRPSSYTEAIGDTICEGIERGLPPEFACPLAGISRATFYNWKGRGEAGEEPYAGFLDRLQEAEARFLSSRLDSIRTAVGGKDAAPWANHAWLAERRFPRHFGKTVQEVEHTGPATTIRVELALPEGLTDDERWRRMSDNAGPPVAKG